MICQDMAKTIQAHSQRIAIGVCAATLVASSGCTEHRIELNELVAMEQSHVASVRARATRTASLDVDSQLGPYRVGAGDVLRLTLTGADGSEIYPPISVRVDREGKLVLPIAGTVVVNNLELMDVESAVRRAYVPNIYNGVNCHAELVTTGTTDVLVTGAVTLPGLVQLRRTERNLLHAIVGAGGASSLASGRTTLKRVRSPGIEETLDLTDPVELREALALPPLEYGDIIYVHPAKPNTIFVGGLVQRPGPQDYANGTTITVLQALAAANGVRTDVAPREATLIRRMPNGEDAHVLLPLDQMATGAAPNITLAAGDILWIPETWETRVQDFFNRNVFIRAGASVNYNVTGVEYMNRRSAQSRNGFGGSLQDSFDPLGFLGQNAALQSINTQTAP